MLNKMKRRNDSDFDPAEDAPDSEDAVAADPVADFDGDDPRGTNSDPRAQASDFDRRLNEQQDKYLRLAAEYDNYRKRTARERAERQSRAQGDLVRQLVDALDDLARFAHVDPATIDSGTVVQGVDLVEKKMLKVL